MKNQSILIAAVVLLAALMSPLGARSQEKEEQKAPNLPRYSITDLGTLGTFNIATGLNNEGAVVGFSDIPGDHHAFVWRAGVKTNLGTLGGPQSVVGFNNPINDSGAVTGASTISTTDPNGEDFCVIGSTVICLPFVWEKGVMTALPLLGGNNGMASAINNRGQIVGVAETPNSDPCSFGFLQVEAVVWEKGEVHELPPFPGDSIGNAIANNDKGEVVGATGCVATNTVRAVLWPDGPNGGVIDLGNLGSGAFNIAFAINNRGQIVGQSTLPDTIHAFLWQDGVMNDLGSLPGLPVSLANGINSHGQVVGYSSDANFDESANVAWLWQNGTMTDLNSLTPAGSPWFLMEAIGINDRGQIAGKMFNLLTGDIHGFLATPVSGKETSPPAVQRSTSERPPIILPESVRQMLQQRRGFGRALRRSPRKNTSSVVSSEPIATLIPTSLGFGTVAIGTTSAAKTVTLKNIGTATLTISKIAITGTNAGDFAQTHNCGSSLAAGASCSISVTFKPSASGMRTAALSVSDTGGGSPQAIPLSGTGVVGFKCTKAGYQCWSGVPPCCPGLSCVALGIRHYCEPYSSSGAVRTSAPWGQALVEKLQ